MRRQGKRQAEPSDARLARAIGEVYRNGDWRDDAWFLKDREEFVSSNRQGRYSYASLVRAADALAQVFTAEACRQILSNPGRGPFVSILFHCMNRERLFPFIRLGLDLADLGVAAESLFARLRDGAEFEGARLEIELWAALVRAGVDVEYGPTVGPPNDPSPDLLVRWDCREYFVEAKSLRLSDADLVGREIGEAVAFAAMSASSRNDCGLILRYSDELASLTLSPEGRRTLQGHLAEVVDRLVGLLRGVMNGSVPEGEHDVLDLGKVTVAKADEDSVLQIGQFREVTPEKESERVHRLVRQAARQLPNRGRGVVFVDASPRTDLDDLQQLVTARSTLSGPRLANAHFAVVRVDCRPTVARLIPMPGVAVTDGDQSLARLLVSGRG